MNTNAVFVYGTLRKGGSNHFRMAGSDFIGEGKISGKMYKIDWYPALLCGGETFVKGEFYRVDDKTLDALDEFEGITPDASVPREYRRVRVTVALSAEHPEDAWVWEWIGGVENATALDGEDWLAYEPNPS